MEFFLNFYVALFVVVGIPVAMYAGGRGVITSTVIKYVGSIVIAVGGIGAHRAYMGREVGIVVAVIGLVLFANGLKGELVRELRQEFDSPVGRQ